MLNASTSAMARFTPCVILILWLFLAPNVHAHHSIASVTLQVIALCGTCQVLILGEIHRKPESPMLFTNLVRRLVRKGKRVLVGLEISVAQQDALDAVMAGTRTPAGMAHPIIDSPYFQNMLIELSWL